MNLPRVLSGAEDLRALMGAAQAAGRPVSLLLGPMPNGGAVFIPPAQRLAHLQPLACSRGLYLVLFEKELPPESLEGLPRNIFFWKGTVHELRGILGEGFAAEAASMGGVTAYGLDRDLLLDLNTMLVPQGALSVYLFTEPGSRAVSQLRERMVRVGLRGVHVEEVEVESLIQARPTDPALEAQRPIPGWPTPLTTLVSATAFRTPLSQPEKGDPFVIGLNEVLDRDDSDHAYVLAAAVTWLRHGFPAPITTLRKADGAAGILRFLRAFLKPYAEIDFRRDGIARSALVAIQDLCALLDLRHGREGGRRIPFLQALVREYPRHVTGPSYAGLWSWLARITCAPEGRLRELHERDLFAVIAEVLPPRAALAAMTDQVIAAQPGETFYPRDVWNRLAVRTGIGEASLMNGPLRPAVVAEFWRHWDRLGEQSRRTLIGGLSADLEGLRAVGFEPPFECLPRGERDRKIYEGLRAIFESEIPLIPCDQTVEKLCRLLAGRGVILMKPQLDLMFSGLSPDLLWLGVDNRVIDERFLGSKRISRPQPPASPPTPPHISSPPPKPVSPPPTPPDDRVVWAAGLEADLSRFLSRRGR